MSDEAAAGPGQGPSKRGDAAWREARERVADRNDEARKAGRQRRKAYEQQKADARRVAERLQMEQMATNARRSLRPPSA
jgi:hypothetical protein